MNIAFGTAKLKCSSCDTVSEVLADRAEFSVTDGSDLLPETETNYDWEGKVTCSECSSEIKFKYHVKEFPTGRFQKEVWESEDGKLVEGFNFDFVGSGEY